MSQGKSKGKFGQLPLELIQTILAALPDIESLTSAVLTGSHLYYAFKDAEARITTSVLHQQINEDLLHDALAAKVSSLPKWVSSSEEVKHFLSQYSARDQAPFHFSPQWNLSQALPLARLSSIIDFFVCDLVSSILTQKPSTKNTEATFPDRPLSWSERNRISRNFYRFEIYCNIFGSKESCFGTVEQRDEYFAHFAPWENEQLACIHDYLSRIINPAFDEVSESDPDWVSFFAIVKNAQDRGCQQYHLSLGLAHIRRFAEANTPQARRDLLAPPGYKKSNGYFLSDGLKESIHMGGDTLSSLDPENEEDSVSKPWYSDPDPGPEDIWRWAHHSQSSEEFVFSPSQEPLRQWAYVMWDRARLDDWGVFETPWAGFISRDEYERLETSRAYEEDAMFEMRARNMVREGRLEASWQYL